MAQVRYSLQYRSEKVHDLLVLGLLASGERGPSLMQGEHCRYHTIRINSGRMVHPIRNLM
jgi:hypothetical protein